MSRFSDETALYYFNRGVSTAAYLELGCHEGAGEFGERVFRFSVWAPNAESVSVVGTFNKWNEKADPMERVGTTGVWEVAIGVAKPGDLYKYAIGTYTGETILKADPFAFRAEAHGTASIVGDMPYYDWSDEDYIECRDDNPDTGSGPMNIYEVHLGSWKQGLGYTELAHELIDYVVEMGYTHIELMPLMEYPYDPSWGYQVTGYYAATARYGEPEELMYLVDCAHNAGIGVIMDWVPAHFTRDAHGLRLFDGTPLFEHPDPRRGEMPQWGTLLFNFEQTQVQSFLISSAMYWLREFHFDGLRVDAVSAMLYLDFGKNPGEWLPNRYGGHDNLDAVTFFRKLNSAVAKLDGGKMLFAEESSAYPYVTRPVSEDGLGFAYKWNMGWMNDMLTYMSMDSIYRKYHHDKLTFSLCYAFSEHYVLPFSHDEVVHGKKSMLSKMPGDYWQQFAQLRLLYAYQYAHPGKKLMFMGCEFGQYIEWKEDDSLDWFLLDYPKHAEMQLYVHDLNHFYLENPPMFEIDDTWAGFRWCGVDDNIHSILSFMRIDGDGNCLLWTFNFTPQPWLDYMIGVPRYGLYTEVFSTDAPYYGGTGDYPNAPTMSVCEPYGEHPCRIRLRLPPFGAVCYRITPKPLPKIEAKQEDDA